MAKNSQQTCRLCGLSGVMTSIAEPKNENYVKKIADFLHIDIDINDPMPKVLCHRCVIKIDDFQEFYSSSHKTQEQLRKIYYPKEQIATRGWSNHQNIPSVNINGYQYLNSAPEPLPIVDINPPTTIQFNLLTYSNPDDSMMSNTRVENNLNIVAPRNDTELIDFGNEEERTCSVTAGRAIVSRGGSRPFPKKPGQSPSTSSNNLETVSRRSSSDVEVLQDSTEISSIDDKREAEEHQESSVTEGNTSGTANFALAPPKKKKKYLSPFERPGRRRGRRKKAGEGQKPATKRPKKILSSTDDDTSAVDSANEVSSIPEHDLEKHFILTKVPSVGTIYTCKRCETILMSLKAACTHTKCLNREESSSEEEQDKNSSSAESSEREPSDTSKSDTTEKESIYQCSYCDKPFTRNAACLQHEQTHLRDMSISDEEDVYIQPKKPKISKKKDYDFSLVKGFFR